MRETTEQPAALGIRHGDTVKVMSGRSKGKTGKVLSVNRYKRTVTVEHASIIKRHTRPNPSKNIKGGILEKEGPIHVSNVSLVCPNCGPAKIGYKVDGDTKVRMCKKCGQTLPTKK